MLRMKQISFINYFRNRMNFISVVVLYALDLRSSQKIILYYLKNKINITIANYEEIKNSVII